MAHQFPEVTGEPAAHGATILAKQAGPDRVEVHFEEHAKWAKTGFGDLLIEKAIRFRAIGAPSAFYHAKPRNR
ncbi:MAG: hypothetical protein JRJ26_18315 [Deltaproteobacteria bacterium]|nr:hypothetical protein [Deltaproteobacteria bacterium]